MTGRHMRSQDGAKLLKRFGKRLEDCCLSRVSLSSRLRRLVQSCCVCRHDLWSMRALISVARITRTESWIGKCSSCYAADHEVSYRRTIGRVRAKSDCCCGHKDRFRFWSSRNIPQGLASWIATDRGSRCALIAWKCTWTCRRGLDGASHRHER